MIDRPRIGCLADHDMRHYQFQRNSGLPRDTFQRRRISPDAVVFWVCLVGFLVAMWVSQ